MSFAQADHHGWTSIRHIATDDVTSGPFAAHDRQGWILGWTDAGGQLIVAYISGNGALRLQALGEARQLYGVASSGSSVTALVSGGSGSLALIAAIGYTPEPEPIIWRSVQRVELPPSAVGFVRAPTANRESLTSHLFFHSDYAIGTALTWWTSPASLSYVELTEEGPVLPVRSLTASGNGAKYPQSLVNEALRDLGR